MLSGDYEIVKLFSGGPVANPAGTRTAAFFKRIEPYRYEGSRQVQKFFNFFLKKNRPETAKKR
ncbi:hypothetical protein SAMN05192553_103232 [Cyclobacterium xiamenense]|uniref:Uncharacterized protein n=1 Tax=Cyclobacterium xiamenense TaxID=1297121 RepID=A0A1H6Y4D5_9BACT|nr:hypothetical protein SAMN05192553_103232 [Cyclobacterium xiamenense]